MKRIVVCGGTGLIGTEVLKLLAARPDVRATALTRRAAGLAVPGRIDEAVVDLNDPRAFEWACDAAICCVGTTMRAAGSRAAFRRVDHDIPVNLIKGVKSASPRAVFGLVSSVGAEAPRGFYLTVKREVEDALRASGLSAVVARPSLLLGDRQEPRPTEKVLGAVLPGVFGVLNGVTGKRFAAVGKYQPVQARDVASALVRAVLDGDGGRWRVIEGYAFTGAGER